MSSKAASTSFSRAGCGPRRAAMERYLRHPAMDRKAGRTNKSAGGAHRRSVIVSVMESLRANLPTFNLATVLEEVGRWLNDGMSLFARQWQALRRTATERPGLTQQAKQKNA